MICSIHQLHYLPWLRYVAKIASSDVFVVLDDVQFTKNDWQHRNRVKGPTGPVLLTVPVRQAWPQALNAVMIAPGRWAARHARALALYYGRAPYYAPFAARLAAIYATPWARLGDLCRVQLTDLLAWLGITTPLVWSSELGVRGVATERLVQICQAVGADTYLSGAQALASYLDPVPFAAAGIRVVGQRWQAPVYAQQYPQAGFLPDLATLDLLFNTGPATAARLLRQGGGGAADLGEAGR